MATPITNTPIPAYTALPDVPADLTAGFGNLEKFVIPRFATATARDTAIPAPVMGMVCYVTGTGFQQYNGSWVALLPTVPIVPPMQSGTASLVFSASTTSTVAVTFAGGRFSSTPAITTTVAAAAGATNGMTLRVSPASSTGFTINGTLSSSSTTTVPVYWIALDPTY